MMARAAKFSVQLAIEKSIEVEILKKKSREIDFCHMALPLVNPNSAQRDPRTFDLFQTFWSISFGAHGE